jgi:pimeloyl-ACP methyl ester carboxylesterase
VFAAAGMIDAMATRLTRRTVHNGDAALAVFEGGNPEGPTVLLVHGWPDTHRLWSRVVEHLAADFHVVAYDTRGMGESTGPDRDEGYRVSELAADLFAVADAVSPGEPVHVLGHDWGSVQAWEAVCSPAAVGRIASFTSISGPNLDHMGQWVRRQARTATPASLWRLARQGASSSYVLLFVSPVAPSALRRLFTADRWRRMVGRGQGVELTADDVADTLPEDMVAGLRYYRANIAPGMRAPRQRSTTVPVLLLVPTKDHAIREFIHDEVPEWAASLARRDVAEGHWVALGQPELVASETAAFIRRVTGG